MFSSLKQAAFYHIGSVGSSAGRAEDCRVMWLSLGRWFNSAPTEFFYFIIILWCILNLTLNFLNFPYPIFTLFYCSHHCDKFSASTDCNRNQFYFKLSQSDQQTFAKIEKVRSKESYIVTYGFAFTHVQLLLDSSNKGEQKNKISLLSGKLR